MSKPLVLTLRLDKSTADFLTNLRAKYFPKHRNHLNAHVTLFHAVPSSRRGHLDQAVKEICTRQREFGIAVRRPSKMGKRGVMVRIREEKRGKIEGFHRTIVQRLSGDQGEPHHHQEEGPRQNGRDRHEHSDRAGDGVEGLTDQDLAPLRSAHVTVLNKATEEEQVERCFAELDELFNGMQGQRYEGRTIGFQLWEYDRGPWIHLQDYAFAS